MENVFLSILNMSLTASYIIPFVMVARLLLKKMPKVYSYCLWSVVLFRLLCPFSLESALSLLPKEAEPITRSTLIAENPEIQAGIPTIDQSINSSLPTAPPPETGNSVNPLQIWTFVAQMLWVSGIIVMLLVASISFLRLKKKLVVSEEIEKGVFFADHITSPFVLGVISPKIYLPSTINEEETPLILAHEIFHLKRFDHVTRLLSFVALTLHWFNPLVWISYYLSEKDMETSCDEGVLREKSLGERGDYATALLKFTGRRTSLTPLAFSENDTKGRVKNIMKMKKYKMYSLVLPTILVFGLIFGFSTNQENQSQEHQVAKTIFFRLSGQGEVEISIGDYSGTEYDNKDFETLVWTESQEDIITKLKNFSEGTEVTMVSTGDMEVELFDTCVKLLLPYLPEKIDLFMTEYGAVVEKIYAFKGLELYVWKTESGNLRYNLMLGTDALKRESDIYDYGGVYGSTDDIHNIIKLLSAYDYDFLHVSLMSEDVGKEEFEEISDILSVNLHPNSSMVTGYHDGIFMGEGTPVAPEMTEEPPERQNNDVNDPIIENREKVWSNPLVISPQEMTEEQELILSYEGFLCEEPISFVFLLKSMPMNAPETWSERSNLPTVELIDYSFLVVNEEMALTLQDSLPELKGIFKDFPEVKTVTLLLEENTSVNSVQQGNRSLIMSADYCDDVIFQIADSIEDISTEQNLLDFENSFYLYNFSEEPTAIFYQLQPVGYAIYDFNSGLVLEYTKEENHTRYLDLSKRYYYDGVFRYYELTEDGFKNLLTEQVERID